VNTFSESVHVSQTMRNDTFLMEWIENEGKSPNAEQILGITNYLNQYKTKNNYNNAFLVSEKTHNYYCYNGINKVVSKEDAHDIWYYNFVESGEDYRLEIDYDEINSNYITLFVNCRIEDENKKFLGVVGVGFQIVKIQSLLEEYEKDYKIGAYLVDESGNIMIRSNETSIISDNYFNNMKNDEIVKKITSNKEGPQIQWINGGDLDKCVITQYIKDFQWYLIIEKDNSEEKAAFAAQFKSNTIVIFVVEVLVILIITYIVKMYNDIVRKLATTDKLTKLQNREAFYDNFEKMRQKNDYKNGTFFIFDVDNFKKINDTNGHMYGDEILSYVAKIAADIFKDNGIIARWGGDEFIGIMKENSSNKEILDNFVKLLLSGENEFSMPISVSLGMTQITEDITIEEAVVNADAAMYRAKENGKGKVC
ncbi:MAG: diguanylate cyclase, partial [Clostridia bacterium]